jgi:hypothetical protein
MSLAMLMPLLLAGVALPATDLPAPDRAAIDARLREVFRPYSRPPVAKAAWDYPVFSAEMTALIAHWKRVQPKDEPDDLNDGDWFCLCQDFDEKKFRATPGAVQLVGPGVAEVAVSVFLGFDEPRSERLVLKQEAGGWRVDDLLAPEDFPHGLKQKLRETIAADEALRTRHR